ncbi:MAG: helix-turn-helix domain-containing protein [Clostridia bacterium]|nr:helix-turn-helix domain-containing protein [Clostridia bacterium]
MENFQKNAKLMSIIDFINLTRCKLAKDMPRSSNLKINEIALKSGFSSISYFTRTYKKVMGYTPSKEKQ